MKWAPAFNFSSFKGKYISFLRLPGLDFLLFMRHFSYTKILGLHLTALSVHFKCKMWKRQTCFCKKYMCTHQEKRNRSKFPISYTQLQTWFCNTKYVKWPWKDVYAKGKAIIQCMWIEITRSLGQKLLNQTFLLLFSRYSLDTLRPGEIQIKLSSMLYFSSSNHCILYKRSRGFRQALKVRTVSMAALLPLG